jgi:hypothetical protein
MKQQARTFSVAGVMIDTGEVKQGLQPAKESRGEWVCWIIGYSL